MHEERTDRRAIQGLELRAADGGKGLPTIVGYAAVYESWSEELPGWPPFREKIARGAFRSALKGGPDIRAFREHNPENVLGRTPKTLTVVEDRKGLRVEIQPPDTELGRSTVELVRRGDIDGMSFAFRTADHGDTWSEDGSERIVSDISEVPEVSIVSFPAYRATSAQATRGMSTRLYYEAQADRLRRKINKYLTGR